MVGFGFMDNVIMIQAGDYIDSTLGVTLGLSTLTAAAFGQVVSDVSGTLFGNTIDHIAARSGLPTAKLTDSQRRMRRVRLAGMAGAVGGVIVGCLLGMTTLLFKDLGKNERLRRQREMSTLFSTLMQEGRSLPCVRCALPPLPSKTPARVGAPVLLPSPSSGGAASVLSL